MRILLDTVTISETRKSRPSPNVLAWLASVPRDDLRISVASLYEIQRGILSAERRDPSFARILKPWLKQLSRDYADQLIPIDRAVALRWAALSVAVGNEDIDLIIAASALEQSLVVATRNTSHFLRAGVPVLNPFEPNPTVVRPTL